MILDKMDPPPCYTPKPSAGSLLATFPPHVLLQIVYRTFPQIDGPDLAMLEVRRKTLYWLSTSLRLVNRAFYIASMHVLRSTYLPDYLSLVRPPYSSDPFPLSADFSPDAAPLYTPGSTTSLNSYADPLHSTQRESSVLDLFIVVKVREDVWAGDTELHLDRPEFFKDLFDLHQPRSRLEDLIRIYGTQDSVVTLQTPSSAPSSLYSTPSASSVNLARQSKPQASPTARSPTTTYRSFFSFRQNSSNKSSVSAFAPPRSQPQPITPIHFSQLSISFTPRKVGLVLTEKQRKRTIVEIQRNREDTLQTTAQQLVAELRCWLKQGEAL